MTAETLASLLAWAKARLGQCGIDTPALDARLLLQHVTGLDHGALIAHPDEPISADQTKEFRGLVGRRCRREPVSRIVGRREFYGREFQLGRETLDPRPDTEVAIEAALALLRDMEAPRILDLGTGSGAIAVTLLAELPRARAVATDISDEALEVTAGNARQHGVANRLELRRSSWFSDVNECFNLVISNPPYVESPQIDTLPPEVKDWDPRRALDGGPDGLDCYREIAKGAQARLLPLGHVIIEVGAGQAGKVAEIFARHGFDVKKQHCDIAGHVRCLVLGIRKMGVGNALDLGYIPTR